MPGVVTGDNSLKGSNTLGISSSDTAKESSVQIRFIGRITVAVGDDTGIDAGRIAVPEVEVDVGHGLAGVDIDDLDIHSHGHTDLVLSHVLADEIARNVVGTLSHFWNQDTAAVAFEEVGLVDVHVDVAVV